MNTLPSSGSTLKNKATFDILLRTHIILVGIYQMRKSLHTPARHKRKCVSISVDNMSFASSICPFYKLISVLLSKPIDIGIAFKHFHQSVKRSTHSSQPVITLAKYDFVSTTATKEFLTTQNLFYY
jgi:hypothetical protein